MLNPTARNSRTSHISPSRIPMGSNPFCCQVIASRVTSNGSSPIQTNPTTTVGSIHRSLSSLRLRRALYLPLRSSSPSPIPSPMAWLRSLARFSRATKPYAADLPLFPRGGAAASLCTGLAEAGFSGLAEAGFSGLGPTEPGGETKPRVVVLGTGWAGSRLMKDLDTRAYDVVCVAPRNHMVFTPLLASTCVGTLEFRSVAEPIGRIQPAISTAPGSFFFLANCTRVDPDAHTVSMWLILSKLGERGSRREPIDLRKRLEFLQC